MLRTHTCGELNIDLAGKEVRLAGWVHRRRDLGQIIFVDLRDRYGLTQIKFDAERHPEIWEAAYKLRNEWVISITGKVLERPKNMVNDKMKTGAIEIEAETLEIISEAKVLPFEINNEDKIAETAENLRLTYRFLDLRREKLQTMLATKDKFIRHIRRYFQERDFVEIQTPILANSSPEGARDFLIPSRLYPGRFFALPQAPQQFKQLLMVGGLDRYFQIAPCFRDEDSRFDRHYGEFYQVDMEMSFVEQEDIFAMMEPLMIELTETFSQKKIMNLESDDSFVRLPWRTAMEVYGSDKPDLRFDWRIKPVTEIAANCAFSVFKDTIDAGGVVHALVIPGGTSFSRKEIDELTELAKKKKAKGLAYIQYKESGEITSPIVKFLGEEKTNEIIEKAGAKAGDLILLVADKWRVVCDALGFLRNECATRLGLKDNNLAAWCWIIDFPMYDYSDIEEGRVDFAHNPFSMPQGGLKALEEKDPLDILAFQYDLVLNGLEISSGAVRNHKPDIMYKAFEVAGYGPEEVDKKFGGMIKAFQYGAPPHAGNAPGLDRLLMVLNDWNSIRDIYAFPKDGQGKDLLMGAPGEVSAKQLEELQIKLDLKNKD
jgi:aspartyl-tRNA synthetase